MPNSPETKITVLEHQMQEIKQEVSELRKDTREGFDKLGSKLDCYVTKETYNKDMKDVYDKLTKSSGNWDWVVKTVMGLIIGALVAKLLMG
jgi:uncharacterized protein (UPF0335 family)